MVRRKGTLLKALCWGVLLAALNGKATADIIPAGRVPPWQNNIGVPGGIPTDRTIYVNVVDLGADPNGLNDSSAIIQSAIDSCPQGQVVYIPEGTFRLGTLLHVQNSQLCTVRGAGMGRTILFGPNNNPIFTAGDATWPPPEQDPANWIPIISGAIKGSNTITVVDSTRFVVGAPMAVVPNPLPVWAHNLDGFPDTLRTMRVYFKIRSKTNTTVTFDPPCPFDFSGLTPTALVDPTPYMQGVGLESLTLDMSNNTNEIPLWFQQAWGCWAKDVEIKRAYSRQMRWDMVVRCEVRGCYTHDVQGSGPNHEGIEFSYASWNLIEDNICNNGGAPPILLEENLTSSSCNVMGYNYVTNTDPAFWDLSFSHGSGSILNLAESNVINNFEDDGYYGSSSYNTLFRNRISGQLRLKHFSDYYNVVGNILGDTWANTYETDVADYWDQGIAPVYELGFPNIGNASYTDTFGPTDPPNYSALPNTLDGCQQLDRNVRATILRHGNWDYATQSVVWDPSIPDHTIPSSLYYSTQPGWWPAGVSWPVIGPDLNPMVGQIPAQIRFLTQSTPTPTPTPTCAPPAAPSVQSATNITFSSFIANWSNINGATGYRLDVSTSSTFATYVPGYQDLDVGNVISYNVAGLSAHTTYYYRVRAYNGCATSPNSSVKNIQTLSCTPAAPSVQSATNLTFNSFTAHWASVSGATSYRLDVSTTNTFATYVPGYHDLDVGNVTSYRVTGLTAHTSYYYRVRAYNGCATSSNSSVKNIQTLSCTPAAPNAQSATNVTSTSFSAHWSSVNGATDYRLDVSTTNTFTTYVPGYHDLSVGNVTNYPVTALSANTTYYYRLRTYNGCAISPNSNVVSVRTKTG